MGWKAEEWEVETRKGKEFSIDHIVQTGSGAHPALYSKDTGGIFPGVKQQRREADDSLPFSVEIKETWTYIATVPCVVA
jgi:hypothetical protein